MRLGPLSRRDRPRLAELLAATGAFNDDEIEVALSLLDAGSDYEFLGAFDEQSGRLIGYACFGATPATDGTYDLYWLAVDPAAQGRGIGSALIRAVEEKLVGRGAQVPTLAIARAG